MKPKTFLAITAVIFLFIGVLQLIRAFLKLEAVIWNFELPVWISYVLGLFALFLSYHGFRLACSKSKN
ncbi:MAG: hypothetical protein AABW90_03815 [Nanoarchaeota archaeon]